jgi:hypothetical protein
VPRHELGAVQIVEHVDALPAVDLADGPQLGPVQASELDCGFYSLMLTPTCHVERPVTCCATRSDME